LKRFVDDIAIEAIEAKLISPLHDIFSPVAVTFMPADLVTGIAGESEENRAQREQWVIGSIGNMESAISSWRKVWCCARARVGEGRTYGLTRITELGVDLYIDFWAGKRWN
jgi:hypothetical protein